MGQLGTAAWSSVAALLLACHPALAIDTMESIGAVKCGGPVKSYAVEFLASETTAVEATAKAMVKGAPDINPGAVTLSIDGKPCSEGRCGFQAKKGETYKFAATSGLPRVDDLCVVVARP